MGWIILGNVEAMWGLSWEDFGATWVNIGAILGNVGARFGNIWRSWGLLGPILRVRV